MTIIPIQRAYLSNAGDLVADIENRWATFTDDELRELDRALDSEWPLPHDIDIRVEVLGRGVRSEIERRKAADGR